MATALAALDLALGQLQHVVCRLTNRAQDGAAPDRERLGELLGEIRSRQHPHDLGSRGEGSNRDGKLYPSSLSTKAPKRRRNPNKTAYDIPCSVAALANADDLNMDDQPKTRLICRRCAARMKLARQLPWLDHRLPAVLLFQCIDCGHVDMVEWPESDEEAP